MPVIIVSNEIPENVCSKPGSERRKWNQMVRCGYIGKIACDSGYGGRMN